ncbi:MAG: exodeoxyribonuclease VII small subunit [Polyangiales bacterium]|nr:exodeoxyribonuclease VII small subunit [Myxococcales bacterium]MCB9657612.1 exodeoxyribonuclease VII small subunit [Sandaracinaceae bacterium]
MPPPPKRPRAEPLSDTRRGPADEHGADLRAASFESVMDELQTVVGRLEEGELSLEESLAAFELGVRLSREGSRRLEAAERRVEALLDNGPPDADRPGGPEISSP